MDKDREEYVLQHQKITRSKTATKIQDSQIIETSEVSFLTETLKIEKRRSKSTVQKKSPSLRMRSDTLHPQELKTVNIMSYIYIQLCHEISDLYLSKRGVQYNRVSHLEQS